MAETRDVRAVMDEAERAAGSGDFVTAASLLRQAADLQEAALGPTHPDLANTLNNLGVVCERIERPAEAERCYRRAHAIASATLPLDHPFVVMSARNLHDFCDARGIPFDEAPAAPTPAAPVVPVPPAPLTSPVAPAPAAPSPAATREPSPPPAPRDPTTPPARPASMHAPTPPAKASPNVVARPPAAESASGSTRRFALVAIIVIAVLAVLALLLLRTRGSARADLPGARATTLSPGGATTAEAPEPSAPRGPTPSDPEPPRPAPQTSAPATSPVPAPTATSSPSSRSSSPAPTSVARGGDATAAPAASMPTPVADDAEASGTRVVEAHVCSRLQTGAQWRCTPPDGPVSSGAVYFYTRLSVSSSTTVEHRWFQGSRLHQTVPLRVPAVSSYRTYSQITVTPARAGEWRVEVRSSSGAVLQEARFTIAP